MTKPQKFMFFLFALCTMALLAVGAVLIDSRFTLAMVLCGVGLVLAASGFVLKRRVMGGNAKNP